MKTSRIDNVEIQIVKDKSEWTDLDKKKLSLNTKAMIILLNALNTSESMYVSNCTMAKEIWEKLQLKHEGTNQEKESKINMLMHSYELFKMEPNETIIEMDLRLNKIFNSLEALGKVFTNHEKVQVLRSLPPE